MFCIFRRHQPFSLLSIFQSRYLDWSSFRSDLIKLLSFSLFPLSVNKVDRHLPKEFNFYADPFPNFIASVIIFHHHIDPEKETKIPRSPLSSFHQSGIIQSCNVVVWFGEIKPSFRLQRGNIERVMEWLKW